MVYTLTLMLMLTRSHLILLEDLVVLTLTRPPAPGCQLSGTLKAHIHVQGSAARVHARRRPVS